MRRRRPRTSERALCCEQKVSHRNPIASIPEGPRRVTERSNTRHEHRFRPHTSHPDGAARLFRERSGSWRRRGRSGIRERARDAPRTRRSLRPVFLSGPGPIPLVVGERPLAWPSRHGFRTEEPMPAMKGVPDQTSSLGRTRILRSAPDDARPRPGTAIRPPADARPSAGRATVDPSTPPSQAGPRGLMRRSHRPSSRGCRYLVLGMHGAPAPISFQQ